VPDPLRRTPTCTPRARAIALYALLLLTALSAQHARAQEQTISVLRHGVVTSLTLPEYKSQGVSYASLRDLARQLGASVELGEARATFRLEGQSAEAGVNGTAVRGGSADVTLRHPLLAYEGDALIAMDDVVPFLRGSFGFGTPENPPATSALSLPPAPATEMAAGDFESVALESVELPDDTAMEESAIGLESIEIRPDAGDTPPAPTAAPAPLTLGAGQSFMLAIDPGHGGEDSGVAGAGGLLEKDLCLAVAASLGRILKEEYGIATIMTRDKDETVSAQARLSRAATGRATLVLSLHGGASTAADARGYQIYAHRPTRTLSTDPRPALGAAQVLAKTLDAATGQTPRPVRETSLLLMRQGNVPSILVELGNLVNPEDEALLGSESYRDTLAAALAAGISAAVGGRAASGDPS